MSAIQARTEVRRYRGRPGRWPFGDTQELQRRYFLWGFCIWTRTLDIEVIPPWAVIQISCLGYTDWVSRFASYIDSQRHQGA